MDTSQIEDDVRAPIAVEVAERIIDTMGLHAIPHADSLTVKVSGNVVTVSGTTRWSHGHNVALVAAAAAPPGVAAHVRHEIRVLG